MIKHATRYECGDVINEINECFEKQVTRLKKIIRKLKKITKKTNNMIDENI